MFPQLDQEELKELIKNHVHVIDLPSLEEIAELNVMSDD